MNAIVNILKILYRRNKILFFVLIIGIALFMVGCSTQSSAPPPSGPIGGGCG